MISNSSAISVPSSQSAHLISPMNVNLNNSQNHQQLMNSSSQNGSLVSHSQSAHQLGHANIPQQPHTPLASHHQALQQQLQKHFANNNMGEYWKPFFFLCDLYLLRNLFIQEIRYASNVRWREKGSCRYRKQASCKVSFWKIELNF